MKEVRIVSNNPMVVFQKEDVRINASGVIRVLEKVRDLVHLGHHLLTHPLAGSIKPNENPFKSVVISAKPLGMDVKSVQIAEDSLETAKRMLKEMPYRSFSDQELNDFMMIDLSLLESAGGRITFF